MSAVSTHLDQFQVLTSDELKERAKSPQKQGNRKKFIREIRGILTAEDARRMEKYISDTCSRIDE